uniref:RING-type domain-containing protein n=1 Tax=Macrostomum lignano TaxID=282301 RepID=A0A1I8FTF6_9PLAT
MATSAAEPGASRSEQELIADCTCPVCQELFQHPQRLTACRHTFCKKCAKKMAAKTSNPMEEAAEMSFGLFGMFHHRERKTSAKEKPGSVCCPICRETSEKFEPDETIEYLVKVLQEMRHQSRCSGAESCLTEATLQCPCCDKRFCQSHHAAQLTALKDSGTALLKDLDSLLSEPDENGDEKLKQLQSAMSESLHRKFADFREQIGLCQSQLQSPLVPDEAERSVLLLDRAVLRQLTSNGAGGRRQACPSASGSKSRAKRAQERWPERRLALQFDAVKMQDDFEGLLAQHASSAVFQSPYEGLPPMLTRVRQQNLSQKPWDIGILSNLEGIVCCDGAIKLRSSVKQVATITPKFNGEGMPGRMHIYNQRQLILTSDASRHRVTVFNLEGRTVTSFGEKGSEPRQFHSPLGLSAFGGQMFVVDAKNLRVQAVGAPPLKLECQPFDVVADDHGNALVTLVREAKVLAVNRCGTKLKTFEFKETAEGRQQMPDDFPMMMMMPMLMANGCPPRMFHGLAFESGSRRLYIADLMRSCV